MSILTLPDFLLADGMNARFNPDGHIAFSYEEFTYLLCFDEQDPEFAHLLLPKVWAVGDPPLLQDVLEGLDLVNRSLKVVKGYTQRDQVSFCIDEIWLEDPADWGRYLHRALRILDFARLQFGAHMAACAALRGKSCAAVTI